MSKRVFNIGDFVRLDGHESQDKSDLCRGQVIGIEKYVGMDGKRVCVYVRWRSSDGAPASKVVKHATEELEAA